MARVKLEVMGWIAAECGQEKTGRLLIEENMESGASVGDLLRRVAQKNPRFDKIVFDDNQTIKGYFSIVLNGKILGQPVFLDAQLKDGDTVMLLPAIDGG